MVYVSTQDRPLCFFFVLKLYSHCADNRYETEIQSSQRDFHPSNPPSMRLLRVPLPSRTYLLRDEWRWVTMRVDEDQTWYVLSSYIFIRRRIDRPIFIPHLLMTVRGRRPFNFGEYYQRAQQYLRFNLISSYIAHIASSHVTLLSLLISSINSEEMIQYWSSGHAYRVNRGLLSFIPLLFI